MAIRLSRARASLPSLIALASAALLAACCTGSVGFASLRGLGSATGGLQFRQSSAQSRHELPRSPEQMWGMSASTGATAVLLFTAAAAFSAKKALCHREVGVQRQAKRGGGIRGFRDIVAYGQEVGDIRDDIKFGSLRVEAIGRGTVMSIRGTGHLKPYYEEPPPPARLYLQKISKGRAIGMWLTKDFFKSNKEVLAASDVKEVGTYMTEPHAPEKLVKPAVLPGYKKPRRQIWLEKERGAKRPPFEDDAYMKYIEKRFGLLEAAQEVCPTAASKDVICDRTTFTLLMDWMEESITKELQRRGHHKSPVDLIRVTKGPGGKGMVLERIYEKKNLWAEFRKYKGSWQRGEISQHGTCSPAWQRACFGDTKTRTVSGTGISQIAGTSKGEFNTTHRFVEFDLGGMSFLSRVRAHARQDGKNVELAHKNFYRQGEVTLLDTYIKMVLGKTDLFVLGLQRSGLLHQVVEVTVDSIMEKLPGVVEVAEKRLGQVVAFLKQVQSALDAESGDGPFVIQWSQGTLILGKYEKVVKVEQEEEELVTA
eukprot:TRINITY_DN104749_c0_g1_i1.p1 TRINITY_DN104749_c0_g1~~TRINITY_DN104749_c0_g1_i1.p1  ORF type:complete len:558 (-),score=115.11 TRINITY_DN104749_c0_g1_i1:67-1683(-)